MRLGPKGCVLSETILGQVLKGTILQPTISKMQGEVCILLVKALRETSQENHGSITEEPNLWDDHPHPVFICAVHHNMHARGAEWDVPFHLLCTFAFSLVTSPLLTTCLTFQILDVMGIICAYFVWNWSGRAMLSLQLSPCMSWTRSR